MFLLALLRAPCLLWRGYVTGGSLFLGLLCHLRFRLYGLELGGKEYGTTNGSVQTNVGLGFRVSSTLEP